MKAIVLVDIPDDCEEYGSGDWYITGDDLNIRYEEDGALMHYKNIKDDMLELKPMPKELDPGISDDYVNYCQGFNDCLDEILGEENV